MVIIYKGEDTQFANLRQIVFTVQADQIPLTGWTARFFFMGIDKCIESTPPATGPWSFTVEYTTDETKEMPLGMNYGTLHLYDAEGKHAQTAKVQIDVRFNNCTCGISSNNQIKVDANNVFVNYNQTANKPKLNGKTIEGEHDSAYYNILSTEGLEAEIERAKSAETALGTRIDNEASARTAADNALSGRINNKQDTISDLDTIRSGASLGATSLQSTSNLNADKLASGTVPSARLPMASGTARGAVNPSAKTTDQTEEVGVDATTGKLYVKPSSAVAWGNITGSIESQTDLKDALGGKVDKVSGKGLSTNDFTGEYKSKLDGIEEGADVNVIESVKVNGTALDVSGKAVDVRLKTVNSTPITGDGNVDTTPSNYSTVQNNAATGATHAGVRTGNPHNVTKADVDLGNVDNTSDADKPISTAQQTELNKKVDKVSGKGLSTNDFTSAEKTKLGGISQGAEVNILETVKVNDVSQTITEKTVNIIVPTSLSGLSSDSQHRTVTDAQKDEWSGKQNALTFDQAPTSGSVNPVTSGGIQEFVNSSINNMAAFYITKDAAGNPFQTHAELTAATKFYSGGVERVPTKNDYCIVLEDEDHQTSLGVNPTTRYVYTVTTYQNGQWSFQYVVNNTALTSAQVAAINSTATKAKIDSIANKTDKKIPASVGNFAALDTNGNLTDSGKKAADFATAAQGAKADSAVQSFSAVGGVTPTVSEGVADVSSLFTSSNTSYNGNVIKIESGSDTTIKSYIDTTVGTIETALAEV